MADTERIEIRISPELLGRLDGARGELPRATWIKRTLESALDGSSQVPQVPLVPKAPPASTRAPVSSSRAKAGVKAIPKGER